MGMEKKTGEFLCFHWDEATMSHLSQLTPYGRWMIYRGGGGAGVAVTLKSPNGIKTAHQSMVDAKIAANSEYVSLVEAAPSGASADLQFDPPQAAEHATETVMALKDDVPRERGVGSLYWRELELYTPVTWVAESSLGEWKIQFQSGSYWLLMPHRKVESFATWAAAAEAADIIYTQAYRTPARWSVIIGEQTIAKLRAGEAIEMEDGFKIIPSSDLNVQMVEDPSFLLSAVARLQEELDASRLECEARKIAMKELARTAGEAIMAADRTNGASEPRDAVDGDADAAKEKTRAALEHAEKLFLALINCKDADPDGDEWFWTLALAAQRRLPMIREALGKSA